MRALPPDAPYRAALGVLRDAPGADALYLPALTWGATRFAERLERELNIPVITLYNSVVWRALTAIGYPLPVAGFGRILGLVGSAGLAAGA